MVHKARNIYSLALYRKSWLSLSKKYPFSHQVVVLNTCSDRQPLSFRGLETNFVICWDRIYWILLCTVYLLLCFQDCLFTFHILLCLIFTNIWEQNACVITWFIKLMIWEVKGSLLEAWSSTHKLRGWDKHNRLSDLPTWSTKREAVSVMLFCWRANKAMHTHMKQWCTKTTLGQRLL